MAHPLAIPRALRPFLGLGAALGVACQDFGLRSADEEVQAPDRVEERFTQQSSSPFDLLVVVANSGSMEEEALTLTRAAPALAAALQDSGLSFQVGVVHADLGAADLGLLQGEPWVMTAQTEDLAGALTAALDRGKEATGDEGGLASALFAIDEPLRSGDNAGFRRPQAGLHILVYSDGDDASDAFLGDDAVALLQSHLAAEAAQSGRSATLHAIVGPGPAGCATEEAHATHGARYLAAATATGGAAWSICEAGLAARWADLLPLPEDLPTIFLLAAVPLEGQLSVTVDEAPTPEGWSLDLNAPALVFDEAPAAGARIAVRYAVAP